ncbi:MAG TPA: TIGR04255 family protein [Methanocorpusculum sp.]|nr:TIGR04255 family protein [Methanocorpusculum sp.]HJJ54150.1 TIGR04255 family protein [Methanocorpusculum sp.]
MQEHKVYLNPPIIEVICGIHVKSDVKMDNKILSTFHEKIREKFPNHQIESRDQKEGEVGKEIIGNENVSTHIFANDKTNARVVIDNDNLSIHWLGAHTSGEKLLQDITDVYAAYITVRPISNITELLLGYLNKVNVNSKEISLDEYFTVVPKAIGRVINFIIGYEIAKEEEQHISRLTLTPTLPEKADDSAFLLEIRGYLPNKITLSTEKKDVAEWFAHTHKTIGEIFESAITDKTRALFQNGNKS